MKLIFFLVVIGVVPVYGQTQIHFGSGDNVGRDKIIYQSIKKTITIEQDQYLLFLGFEVAKLGTADGQSQKMKIACSKLNNLCTNSINDRGFYYQHKAEITECLSSIFALEQKAFVDELNRKIKENYDKARSYPIVSNYNAKLGYSDGLAAVLLNNQWGYVDGNNRLIIPFQFEFVHNFSEQLAAVRIDHRYGYINTNGEKIIDFKYDEAWDFFKGFAIVKLGYNYGIIDRNDFPRVPFEYQMIGQFGENHYGGDIIYFVKDGKMGIMNYDGRVIVDPKYDYEDDGTFLSFYSNSLLNVSVNGLQGYIDGFGKEVVPCVYQKIKMFHEGFCAAKKDGKWGYINLKGDPITQFQFDTAQNFSGSTAECTQNGQKYLVHSDGSITNN